MKFLKKTRLHSIIYGSCPVCQEESMYVEKNPYKLAHTLKMNHKCSSCDTKYKIEPSFFYGAMYVSYPVGIAFAVAAFVISYFVLQLDLFNAYLVIVGVMILALPIILRLSRNIWISFFMSYDTSKRPKKTIVEQK